MHLSRTLFLATLIFIFGSTIYSNAQNLDLEHELLFEYTATLDAPINIGNTPKGKRVIYPVTGGSVKGEKLNGIILPNGGDWSLQVSPKVAKIDVRGIIETADGETIYVQYKGVRKINKDGVPVFRTTPVFETSSEKYSWLNHTIAVGIGKMVDKGIRYKVYAIR